MPLVRPGSPADAKAIAQVEVETWRSAYAGILPEKFLVGMSAQRRAASWESSLSGRPGDVLVAMDSNASIVGFGSCGRQREPAFRFSSEIFTLYVGSDAQGRGTGRLLLMSMFAHLLRHGLSSSLVWVLEDNPSRFFYERLGGRIVARRRLDFAGTTLPAVAYGWPDVSEVIASHGRARSRIE